MASKQSRSQQEPDPADEQWLTPAEVAALLRINPQTLSKLARQARGPVFLQVTEKTRRYRRSDVNKWIEENVQNGRVVYPPFPPTALERLYGAPVRSRGGSPGRRRRSR